jgi:hypothetical protein
MEYVFSFVSSIPGQMTPTVVVAMVAAAQQ